ncbi:MAG: protein kinase [Calditrichaeota bacterium]|nr:protein kinase [Calditrichota bacterium]
MLGKIISHYKILELLGKGGMGEVYKAVDMKLDRFVALKFLPPELNQNQENKQRFIEEAQAASFLDHRNLCTIHQINETEDKQLYIVMAFYEGKTLKEIIEEGDLSPKDAVDIAIQIARGLAAAHAKGIVHCDVKPGNIIVTTEGIVKIVDFGLAKLKGKSTRSEVISGTAAYMSPEQVQGFEVDQRSDIWSLGTIIYEMLFKIPPFHGPSNYDILDSIINDNLKLPDHPSPNIPRDLQKIISHCLEKDTSNRYMTMNEVKADLKKFRTKFKKIKTVAFKGITINFHPLRILYTSLLLLLVFSAILFTNIKNHKTVKRSIIVVTDVRNETKEKELNGLSDMFITSLEQSPRISVMTRERMFDILKQLGKDDITYIDEQLAREICASAHANYILETTLRKFDGQYNFDLKIIDIRKKKFLFTEQARGHGQASIPEMIDRLVVKTRIVFKEKKEDIEAHNKMAVQDLTKNFEAHEHYFIGETLFLQRKFSESEKEFKKAIFMDSTFSLAYYRLACVIREQTENEQLQKSLLKHASELMKDYFPLKQKYMVNAEIAYFEKGAQSAIQILKQVEELYPDEKRLLFKLGEWYWIIQDYKTAVSYFQKCLHLDPTFEPALFNLSRLYRTHGNTEKALYYANRYMKENRKEGSLQVAKIDEQTRNYLSAVKFYNQVIEIDSTNTVAYDGIMRCYKKTKKYREMIKIAKIYARYAKSEYHFRQIVMAFAVANQLPVCLKTLQDVKASNPEKAPLIDCELSGLYQFAGQFGKAEKILLPLVSDSQDAQIRRFAWDRLYRNYLYIGKYRNALKACDEINKLFAGQPKRQAKINLRKALILIWGWNDIERAKAVAQCAVAAQDSIDWNEYWIHLFYFYISTNDLIDAEKIFTAKRNRPNPNIEASIFYSERNECSRADSVIDQLYNSSSDWEKIRSLYHLAICQIEIKSFQKAIHSLITIQNLYDNYGGFRAAYYPKTYYLSGKIYEQLGKNRKAILNYDKFLSLWKNADKDLPDYIDAKRRAGKLKSRLP